MPSLAEKVGKRVSTSTKLLPEWVSCFSTHDVAILVASPPPYRAQPVVGRSYSQILREPFCRYSTAFNFYVAPLMGVRL